MCTAMADQANYAPWTLVAARSAIGSGPAPTQRLDFSNDMAVVAARYIMYFPILFLPLMIGYSMFVQARLRKQQAQNRPPGT